MKKLLLYGANGYTAGLIIRFAEKYDIQPVLAGRSEDKIKTIAEAYKLDYRVFGLEESSVVQHALNDIEVVLHVAGPFMYTAKPMMEACIQTQTHYLDITGEIEVFELGASYNDAAKTAGIMLMPGTGFDVVPTDCMAAYLKEKMPDATHLELAFGATKTGISHGTAKTMVENLGGKGLIREDGKLTEVPVAHKTRRIPFSAGEIFAIAIPWGDVFTAYYTTGIPNIITYMAGGEAMYKQMKKVRYLGWLLNRRWLKNALKKRIDQRPAGPNDESRAATHSLVWGEVRNDKGEAKSARMIGPEGYTLTAHLSLIIAQKVLSGNAPTGFQTPAGAYGADLILELEGTKREDC